MGSTAIIAVFFQCTSSDNSTETNPGISRDEATLPNNLYEISNGRRKFIVASDCEKYNKVFRMTSRVIIFKIKYLDTGTNQVVWLENAMRDIVSFNKHDREECTIGITMNSNEFIQGAAWLYYSPINTFNFKDLWHLFERISQSRREFKLDDTFTIIATCVKTPNGKG